MGTVGSSFHMKWGKERVLWIKRVLCDKEWVLWNVREGTVDFTQSGSLLDQVGTVDKEWVLWIKRGYCG